MALVIDYLEKQKHMDEGEVYTFNYGTVDFHLYVVGLLKP